MIGAESNRGRVLVTAATGTVGGQVVRALIERGAGVRALVRSEARSASLPAAVERVSGDLRDRASVARALDGVSAVFLLAPHEPDKAQLVETVVSLCEEQRVRLVYAGDHIDIGVRWLRRAAQWFYGRKYPHYAASFRIGERILTARTETVLLVPTTFAQNDELFRDEILAGTYPLPYRRVVPVDVRDVADAAGRALADPQVRPGVYALTGPVAMTGAECAAAWSKALGREVRYTGEDLGGFLRLLDSKLEGFKREDWRRSFTLLSGMALPAPNARQLAQTAAVLGRPPRSYAEYVGEAARRWLAPAGS